MMDAMRKLLLGTTLTLAIAFVSPASAMPAGYPLLRDAAVSIDLIEVGGAKVGGTSTVIARLVGAADSGDCDQGFRLNATMRSDRMRPPVPTKAAGVSLPA